MNHITGRRGPGKWTDRPDPLVIKPEPWMRDALCAQVVNDPVWFPPKGGNTERAKAICARCDVRDACLEYALRTNQEHGIWGGKSSLQRKAMRRRAAQKGSM